VPNPKSPVAIAAGVTDEDIGHDSLPPDLMNRRLKRSMMFGRSAEQVQAEPQINFVRFEFN
jgi:hypothetical protein